jgi:uncharacterized protein YggE
MRDSTTVRWLIGLAIAVTAMAPHAAAASYVETEGKATVEAIPNYVEFWFHMLRGGATLEEATGNVAEFETRLRAAIEKHALAPTEVEVSPVAITDVRMSEVQRTARLKFSATNFTDPEEGSRRFASFCDILNGIASEEDWLIEGPEIGVNNKPEFEQLAVADATKNAFPTAEGIAQVLRGSLTSVNAVTVLSLEWNRDPEQRFPLPNVRTVACSAHVQVTYIFEPTSSAAP